MKQAIILWIVAFLITAASAVYQRMTGPTYPYTGSARLPGEEIHYRLERTHAGQTDHSVSIPVATSSVTGTLYWKRHNTDDAWTAVSMNRHERTLEANLPGQPAAGKLDYRVILQEGDHEAMLPENDPIVIRFRGEVPAAILIVHVTAMFGGMLLSVRAGIEAFRKNHQLKNLITWTIGILFIGGLILGPIVQKYAFGAYWTGWPFGNDLTDNKTVAALICWILAAIALRRAKNPARWSVAAAVITLLVYMIPHSVLGSEIDYRKADQQQGSTKQQ